MPDVSTEVAIASTTLGSAATTITFSSIAATYTDLRVVLVFKAAVLTNARVRFNGDTATNYSKTWLNGNGTTAASSASTSVAQIRLNNSGNTAIGDIEFDTIDVFSYAGSTYKTCLITSCNDENGTGGVERSVGLWRSTSAITSITLDSAQTNQFDIGTTATLYGIL